MGATERVTEIIPRTVSDRSLRGSRGLEGLALEGARAFSKRRRQERSRHDNSLQDGGPYERQIGPRENWLRSSIRWLCQVTGLASGLKVQSLVADIVERLPDAALNPAILSEQT